MSDLKALMADLAQQEQSFLAQPFLSPCVLRGKIRVRLSGLLYTLTPLPNTYEGWGYFEAVNSHQAKLIQPAPLPAIDRYLQEGIAVRMRLAFALCGKTWLAYPQEAADFKARFKRLKPFPVHLVKGGSPFEPIVARWDGAALWWHSGDRRSTPLSTKALRQALRQNILPENLAFSGLTPEMKTTYALVCQSMPAFVPKQRDEQRLRKALGVGGGILETFTDHDSYWTVQWKTTDGVLHTSAIAKSDLTVIGAGICLSDRDREFDLQSLVGVIEQH